MLSVVRPALCAALLLTSVSARAQVESREGIALQNQIYQLRSQVQALQDQLSRGGGAPRGPVYAPPPSQPYSGGSELMTQLLTRVDALEEQVRQLRGHVDELQNQVQQQQADLSKRIDDMQFQLGQGARPGLTSAPPPAAPPSAAPPPAQSAPRTPEMILQEGRAALTRRDYAAAEAAARQVLAIKVSPRAYDANLLLAQALAGEKQFPQAAIAYDDTYNRARKGSHAQDALVGLATSLNAINEKKAACDTLTKLRAEFPQMRPDIHDAASALGQKASCR